MKKIIVLALLLAFTAESCEIFNGIYRREVPKDLEIVEADGKVDVDFVSFDQGWDDEARDGFWFTPQGAQVLPYTWFTWLEQPNSTELFRNAEHMSDLGYLPMPESEFNPAGLPIGFAMSKAARMEDAYMGFTCAACHTNMIEHDGEKFLIDGAPTLANFVGLYAELVDALDETYRDNEKFVRFATRVLDDDYSRASATRLRRELLEVAEGAATREKVNALPEHYPKDFTSYGRLDAFTNIMNAGSVFALDMLDNGNYPIAPVSYPFLWGTHQSDRVQWNGSAPNIPRSVGPMVRNAGEVVGVFGGLTIKKKAGRKHKYSYKSSIDFPGLGELEGFVKMLEAPRWDDENSNLPPVDPKRVARGKILYQENCAKCHTVIPHDEQDAFYTSSMVPLETLGTDPVAAWAGAHYMASSGILEGSKAEIIAGDVMKDTVRAISIPVNGIAGLVLRSPGKMIEGVMITKKQGKKHIRKGLTQYNRSLDSLAEIRHQESGHQEWEVAQNTPTDLKLDGLKYKARPLNGIWATAPYLHNGSVPNLWELLQAPKDRVKTFLVGSREFDAKNVGFVTHKGKNKFCVNENCETGPDAKIMLGNSNLGHDYAGGQYTDEQKWDLIEYMKTL